MFSRHFSGMRNTSATSRDTSNLPTIFNKKISNTGFLKRSLIIHETFPFPLNLLPKKKMLSLRLSQPIQLIANNLWNFQNKKLKTKERSKKNFQRLSELRSKKIKSLNYQEQHKLQGFFKEKLLENIFLDFLEQLSLNKLLQLIPPQPKLFFQGYQIY